MTSWASRRISAVPELLVTLGRLFICLFFVSRVTQKNFSHFTKSCNICLWTTAVVRTHYILRVDPTQNGRLAVILDFCYSVLYVGHIQSLCDCWACGCIRSTKSLRSHVCFAMTPSLSNSGVFHTRLKIFLFPKSFPP